MKAVVQRVAAASVAVEDEVIGSIGQGLAILLGVVEGDTEREADFLANKITQLRIFTDSQDKMNLSVEDMGGEMLVVSQFTLAADCSHGGGHPSPGRRNLRRPTACMNILLQRSTGYWERRHRQGSLGRT